MSLVRRCVALALTACLGGGATLLVGCADEPTVVQPDNPLASNADFVAIPRSTDAAARAAHARALPPTGDGPEFYLAIRRGALSERYFLSAFLEQYYPGGVSRGAATVLGTRVVTLREQNDKLFVFDASEGSSSGPVFDPEILVEAYPVVHRFAPFDSLPGANGYVLIDPAAGLNRFDVVSDAFAPAGNPFAIKFQVELAFLQRFRALADGVAYQQVFTGYADVPDPDQANDPTVPNAFQASGTLSIALRRYRESPGFVPRPASAVTRYFTTTPRHASGTGALESFDSHWNIHPGMTPIRWLISRELPRYVAQHPELAGSDPVAAVKRGIESWNDVFGYPVFRAELAGPDDSMSDDDKNFIIFDPVTTVGFAYANWRENPITGEIRGAQVYFGSGWLRANRFSNDPPAPGNLPVAPPVAAAPGLTLRWQGVGDQPLCSMPDDGALIVPGSGDAALTAPQKLDRFIEHLIAHEVGHNLGLRHNFEGSLVPPSSSVMDYLSNNLSVATNRPGSYDRAAVRLLYGLSQDEPVEPFCNDGDMASDPQCLTFDQGSYPLRDYLAPNLTRIYRYFLELGFTDELLLEYATSGPLGFVRKSSGAEAQEAWDMVMAPVRAPVDPLRLAQNPDYGAAADFVARTNFKLLYLNELPTFSQIVDPPGDEGVLTSIVSDLRGNLLDLDGVRSVQTRRLCVDVLKKMQRLDAYRVLIEARGMLAARLAASDPLGDEGLLATDLIARIDAATSPYFQ